MNVEVLLKLRCQQALAQGDYDSLKLYSDQLSMFKDGALLVDLPIVHYWNRAVEKEQEFFQDGEFYAFEQALIDLYGEDLYLMCRSFYKDWNSADLYDALS